MPQYVVRRNKKDDQIVFGGAARALKMQPVGSVSAKMSSSGNANNLDLIQTDRGEDIGAEYKLLFDIPFTEFRTRQYNSDKTALEAKVSYGTTTTAIAGINQVTEFQTADASEVSGGIGTSGSVNTTGIITASQFFKTDGTELTGGGGGVGIGTTRADGEKLNWGDNNELQIFYNDNGTGIIQKSGSGAIDQLQIRCNTIRLLNEATDEDFAFFRDDGAVELYYDDVKRFETTGYGASIIGGLNVTGVSTFTSDISFGGNVSVAGTLTYDDVTNVDSIGLITARTGIEVTSGIITAPKIHVGVGTTYSEELVVTGDARVTGILTIGTGSITLDPSAKRIQGIDEIVIGTDDADKVTIKKDNKGKIKFEDKDGKESSVGIGTTVSINTSGIVTATQFHGDGSKITGISTLNIVDYGVGLGGGGITTFSGNYNDLTNKPTIPTNNNQLSNGAGYITTSITSYNDLSNKPTVPTNNNQLSNGAGYITTSITSYNDLTNKPTIPTNNNQLSNGAGYITTSFTSYNQLSDKPSLATVATSGSYNDLSDKPTIPTNNNQLSNGAGYITTSFTSYNQLSDKPTIPTNNNQLSNGAGYITTSITSYNDLSNKPTIPTSNNQLDNGAGYITTSITSYNDLSDKPSIPAAQIQVNWNSNSGIESILNKPSLATVATSGSYNDLSNKPTIPTSNNQLDNGAGYATEAFVGLATVGLLTATASGASLIGLTGASAGTYGDASNSAQITVDANGRITGITQVTISGGGGGGISNIVEDTSPQLGGNLDLNSKNITGTGNLSVSGVGTFTSLDAVSVTIKDNRYLYFGNSNQGSVVYNAANFEMVTSSGDLNLKGSGSVALFEGNNKKLETTSTGITVTGAIVKSGGTSSQYLMADGSTSTGGGGGGGGVTTGKAIAMAMVFG